MLNQSQRTARAEKGAAARWAKADIEKARLPQVGVKGADLIAHSLSLLEVLDAPHRKALLDEWDNSGNGYSHPDHRYFTPSRLKNISLKLIDLAEELDRRDEGTTLTTDGAEQLSLPFDNQQLAVDLAGREFDHYSADDLYALSAGLKLLAEERSR